MQNEALRDIFSSHQVVISWESRFLADHLLRITVVTPEQLLSIPGKVTVVKEAGLFHQQHPKNFYHLFTEIAPTVHYVKHDNLRLFWVNALKEPDAGGGAGPPQLPQDAKDAWVLPRSIVDLLACITPYPVKNIYTATVEEQKTLLLKRAVVGLPRNVRFYHQNKDEWRERFQDPPPLEYMLSYRQRVATCLDIDFINRKAPTHPVRVTFINRHYDEGRHILNAEALRDQIQEMPQFGPLGGAEVELVYSGGTLRSQAERVANTSIYIWAHGAAMAHTLFLPQGAQALEIVQWVVEDPTNQHIWVQGIQQAFRLQIGLDVLVNTDPTKVFFNYDVIRAPGSQYYKFNNTEKVLLLEELKCPEWHAKSRGITGWECFGWFHWHMSLKLEWAMLWPKVELARNNLQRSLAQLEGSSSSSQLGRQQQLQQGNEQ
ncbi:hypothetical protein N2152v2_005420 [Parachlorella kessleri]